MTQYEVIDTGEQVRVGRVDYGAGWTGMVVTIGDEVFARHSGGMLAAACGYCSPMWSGTKDHHLGVFGGVCFQCNGSGRSGKMRTEKEAVALVKRRVSDERRRVRQAEEREVAQAAALAQWQADNPEVVTMLTEVAADLPEGDDYEARDAAYEKWSTFLIDLATQAEQRPLSEKQTAAVVDAFERAKVEHAAQVAKEEASRWYGAEKDKVTAAPGRITVWATYETNYGYTTQTNALIIVEGTGDYDGVTFKIAGTGKTLWDCDRGDVVEVTGTVKGHGEYEGVKQTQLTRAKVVVTEAAEKEDA